LKKKETEYTKLEFQSVKAIEESAQLKARVKDLEKKLGDLNNTLTDKARLLASREQEINRLKSLESELLTKVEGLEEALQTSKNTLKQKLKQKQSPVKLLEE